MTFPAVDPPAWDRLKGPAWTLDQVDKWLDSRAMRELVAAFGGRLQASSDPAWATKLDDFAASTWDFRQGRERDTAERVTLPPAQQHAALDTAEALGLIRARQPRRRRYDAVLMLGGLVRACLVRPKYAAVLVEHGLRAEEFVGLGAFRSLSEGEVEIATALGVSTNGEYAVMVDGVIRAFRSALAPQAEMSGHDDPREPFGSWRITTWRPAPGNPYLPRDATVSVVAAPSAEPAKRRANTADTYAYWTQSVRRPTSRSVLLITNPIYVVYQGCTAIQELGLKHGLDVEIVGVSPEASDLGAVTQVWSAQDYLQEIRASIKSLVQLRASLAALR